VSCFVKIKLINLISYLLFFNQKSGVTRCIFLVLRNRGSVEVILLYLSFLNSAAIVYTVQYVCASMILRTNDIFLKPDRKGWLAGDGW
jgi:hypothetical protein